MPHGEGTKPQVAGQGMPMGSSVPDHCWDEPERPLPSCE